MATLYDAAERGDFTDPPPQITGWHTFQTRAMKHRSTTQVKAIARLAIAELRSRGVEIHGDDGSGPDGLAMGLMFAAGSVCTALLLFSIYLVVTS